MSVLQCSRIGDVFPLCVRASTEINCYGKSIKVYIVIFPDMPLGWAAIFCNEIDADADADADLSQRKLYLECTAKNVDIAQDMFAPAKYGISTGMEALLHLEPLAHLCKECEIDCIFIDGHFNQCDADITGRGHLLCGGNENIHTMDIFRVAEDPFLGDLVGVTVR